MRTVTVVIVALRGLISALSRVDIPITRVGSLFFFAADTAAADVLTSPIYPWMYWDNENVTYNIRASVPATLAAFVLTFNAFNSIHRTVLRLFDGKIDATIHCSLLLKFTRQLRPVAGPRYFVVILHACIELVVKHVLYNFTVRMAHLNLQILWLRENDFPRAMLNAFGEWSSWSPAS